MSKANQLKTTEARTRDNHIVFFKSQEEFVKALREGTDEEISFSDELVEEE